MVVAVCLFVGIQPFLCLLLKLENALLNLTITQVLDFLLLIQGVNEGNMGKLLALR